jgi:LysM repeat protein
VRQPIAEHRPGTDPAAAKPGQGGGMSALKKKPGLLLAAGGAGLVVLLALMRSGGGSADTAAGTTVQPGGNSSYDSTSNDLYNSIQPEIDALAKMIQDLQNKQPTPTTPPAKTTLPGQVKTPPPIITGRPVTPAKPVKVSKPALKSYTIQRGDTLSGIAKKLHISMTTLKKLNPTFYTNPKYHNGNTIFAGGKVKYQ